MEAHTIQKFIHTAPRKLRLVADMVRRTEPTKAMDILKVVPKAAAADLLKAINSAMANAKGRGLDTEKLTFKRLEINEGPKMKRFRAGARGRARPYQKKMSHIKIVLTDDLNVKTNNLLLAEQMSNVKTKKAKIKEKKGEQTKVVMDNSAENAK